VPIVLKSGRLKLLELSGPVQACNGMALPFTALYRIPLFVGGGAISGAYVEK